MDWNTWIITSGQTASGTGLFLWQPASGKLYLWNNLASDAGTATLTYTEHALSTDWNTGQALTVHGGDVDGDGTADLWAVGAGATATAWLVTDLTAGRARSRPGPARRSSPATSPWPATTTCSKLCPWKVDGRIPSAAAAAG